MRDWSNYNGNKSVRLFNKSGQLPCTFFSFPDSQPHFKLGVHKLEFRDVVVETSITDSDILVMLGLVSSTLRGLGAIPHLDIRYLLGARMDRKISNQEPATLDVLTDFIHLCGFASIRLLDVHSDVSVKLLRAKNLLPTGIFSQVVADFMPEMIVTPDKGAHPRVCELTKGLPLSIGYIQCLKERDPNTGKLSGFTSDATSSLAGKSCLIVDDICDGGGTFAGIHKLLKEKGAGRVGLFVTHGIFSGQARETLKCFDRVYTTDSFGYPWNPPEGLVTFPINMKDLS